MNTPVIQSEADCELQRRDFPEVLDNLLTEVVGGVAAEAQPFPPPGATPGGPLENALEHPRAKRVVSAYGSRNGVSSRFREGIDYELRPDGQTLRWLSAGDLPDEGSIVHVNYLREDVPPTLTDLQVGSVLRTLAKSVSLRSPGFMLSSTLYMTRPLSTPRPEALSRRSWPCSALPASAATALARDPLYPRARHSGEHYHYRRNAHIIDTRARFEYATTDTVTVSPNQNVITVTANDLEPANDPVDANVLTVLPVPIAGISSVTNPAPASRATADETDAELRTRAKSFLHGSERATTGALKQVLARQQVRGEIVEDPDTPGLVRVTVQGPDLPPERVAQLIADLDAARPAGVRIETPGVQLPLPVDLDLKLVTEPRLPEVELKRAHDAVRSALVEYFDSLVLRADASLNQIVGRVLAVAGVQDVQLLSARVHIATGGVETTEERLDAAAGVIHLAGDATVLGELNIADPNLPTGVSVIIRFPAAGPVPDSRPNGSRIGRSDRLPERCRGLGGPWRSGRRGSADAIAGQNPARSAASRTGRRDAHRSRSGRSAAHGGRGCALCRYRLCSAVEWIDKGAYRRCEQLRDVA